MIDYFQGSIVTDHTGDEYLVTKIARVNAQVTRQSDGARLVGPIGMFKFVRKAEAETLAPVEGLRIGAVVKVLADAQILKSNKFNYSPDQKFVVFGQKGFDFKIIELGGNARNSYWTLPATRLEVTN